MNTSQLTRQGVRNLDLIGGRPKSRGRVLEMPPSLAPIDHCQHKETHTLASSETVCEDCGQTFRS